MAPACQVTCQRLSTMGHLASWHVRKTPMKGPIYQGLHARMPNCFRLEEMGHLRAAWTPPCGRSIRRKGGVMIESKLHWSAWPRASWVFTSHACAWPIFAGVRLDRPLPRGLTCGRRRFGYPRHQATKRSNPRTDAITDEHAAGITGVSVFSLTCGIRAPGPAPPKSQELS